MQEVLTSVGGHLFGQTKRTSGISSACRAAWSPYKTLGHDGFEPSTNCLRGSCSTVELMTLIGGY